MQKFLAISDAVRLSVVIEAITCSMAPSGACFTRFAAHIIPTPSLFVKISLSPDFAPLFFQIFFGLTTPVTDNPYLTSLSAIEWPPARLPPASCTFSAPP